MADENRTDTAAELPEDVLSAFDDAVDMDLRPRGAAAILSVSPDVLALGEIAIDFSLPAHGLISVDPVTGAYIHRPVSHCAGEDTLIAMVQGEDGALVNRIITLERHGADEGDCLTDESDITFAAEDDWSSPAAIVAQDSPVVLADASDFDSVLSVATGDGDDVFKAFGDKGSDALLGDWSGDALPVDDDLDTLPATAMIDGDDVFKAFGDKGSDALLGDWSGDATPADDDLENLPPITMIDGGDAGADSLEGDDVFKTFGEKGSDALLGNWSGDAIPADDGLENLPPLAMIDAEADSLEGDDDVLKAFGDEGFDTLTSLEVSDEDDVLSAAPRPAYVYAELTIAGATTAAGGEGLTYVIAGLPGGVGLVNGAGAELSPNRDGVYCLSQSQLSGLELKLPTDGSVAALDLTVTVLSQDGRITATAAGHTHLDFAALLDGLEVIPGDDDLDAFLVEFGARADSVMGGADLTTLRP